MFPWLQSKPKCAGVMKSLFDNSTLGFSSFGELFETQSKESTLVDDVIPTRLVGWRRLTAESVATGRGRRQPYGEDSLDPTTTHLYISSSLKQICKSFAMSNSALGISRIPVRYPRPRVKSLSRPLLAPSLASSTSGVRA